MTDRALVLFDDALARAWRPFTLTRPVGELLFGTATLRARAEHAYGTDCIGHVTAEHLARYDEPWGVPVLDPVSIAGPTIFLLSRFAPEPAEIPEAPALLVADEAVVGVVTETGGVPDGFFLDPDAAAPELPRHPVDGTVLERPWTLVRRNADRVAADLRDADHAAIARDVHHLGPGPVSVGEDVQIAPGVVLDTRAGPIRLDDEVVLEPFTHLVGPAYIGSGTRLLGGRFEAVSIGPVCKVRGEVEGSVLLGYSNKAHDGFLGHAAVGLWVNLGALTTNSDLKNNYGPVRVWTPDGEVETGQRKIGCFLGDHAKTAIGTRINTGTVIEAGSNVFGGMPPKYVPPFSWGDPRTPYDPERFLDTARTVMGRRGIDLTDAQAALLREAWRRGRQGVEGR